MHRLGRRGARGTTEAGPRPIRAATWAVYATCVLVACSGTRPRGLVVGPPGSMAGYVHFNSLIGSTTYLIEARTGAVVHTWESEYAPSGGMYLMDDGTLLRTAREPEVAPFEAGGVGGRIQAITWDGEVVWDYVLSTEDHVTHHDIAPMPNGNVLAIAYEAKSLEEVQGKGYRPEMTPRGGLWPDMVIEIEPVRPSGGRIVWEWHAWDHMIQDIDESLDSFADPAAHPELIDINGGGVQPPDDMPDEDRRSYRELGYVPDDAEFDPTPDFMHTNAIAYNAELDQIALSVPNYNEIWIIDHGTTTEEARGHEGGRQGRGGDLLYRWGNPSTYDRGADADRRLGFQHDVRWIPEGMPGAGNLLLFNNATPPDGDHSSVYEIEPPVDARGRYRLEDGRPYGPETPVWSYVAHDPAEFASPFISGAHRLPSGNTLITAGSQGRFFEVTAAGEIVWEYWSPTSGEVRTADGGLPHPIAPFPYAVFRATKISADHPALRGRDLAPLDPQPAPLPPPDAGGG